jgi:hypothetical protein
MCRPILFPVVWRPVRERYSFTRRGEPAGGGGQMAAISHDGHGSGIAAVPVERRLLGTWDSFVLWADLGISFLVMVVGLKQS